MKIEIDLNKLLSDANDEIDLLPYFVKLELTELGIPIKIDPTNIRDPDFILESGVMDYSINVDSMVMEINYHEQDAA